MGELATHLLEAVARTEIFGTIVVASRNLEKAKKRTNNAVLGAVSYTHLTLPTILLV